MAITDTQQSAQFAASAAVSAAEAKQYALSIEKPIIDIAESVSEAKDAAVVAGLARDEAKDIASGLSASIDFELAAKEAEFESQMQGQRTAFEVSQQDKESDFLSSQSQREADFVESQTDRENRFQTFLDSSGYVFLGDYENGPFQFSARNQYIRYNNQYYRLNAATNVGFTTTGTDATSFANDVTHFVLMDGDTLRQNLGSSESDLGGALVNIGQATVRDVVRANILSYMSKTDQLAIKGVVGTEVVVDYALRAAIDDGVTVLECPPVPGIYVFGQSLVTLPIGFSFEGKSRRTYTATSDASFNNVGTVFRLFNGASAIFKLTSRHTFRQVVFDGRNKTARFMQGNDQTQWCRFYDCGIHRWYVGIGNSSPNGYSATLLVSGGAISSNTIGVKNVIDSLFLGATINANDTDGVQLLTGANNNAFIGVRNEWNNGDNYYGYGCKRILIQGELIDRAGKRAVAAVGGAQFTLSGVAVQRSGRLATEGSVDDAHYYIEGDGSSIIETAVHTTTGANDDGSGRQSPTYILATGGSSSDEKSFQASASNLSGYTGSSWLRSGLVKTLSVLGCSGVEDVKNFGLRRISDGVQYLGDAVSALSLSGAGNTATLTFKTTAQAFSRYSSELLVRTLEIRARNNTSTGSVAYYSVNLIISREYSAAAIAVDTASVRTFATASGGTWGITSASPTGVSLAFAISEDGTTLTVTLTAIDSASRVINARLRA
ncbi:phage tail fiber protein [Klebsiella pneumoniae]|uniref:phage tail fiber protein n=1 Tax=Klebsiella pneumoniae TaxID=573 RepID=UPI0022EC74A2|nr:phage tail fiber protein [Klebsiella pneumoniae]MDA4046274.1 phage tail fiber protein [Klebsiella pneumoniae]